MKNQSISWRLSLSYAAIALLATLLLGVILSTVLFNYYIGQEVAYLTTNAESIGSFMAFFQGEDEIPQDVLEVSLKSFSFISNTQVRLLDENENLIADSGLPQNFQAFPLSSFSGVGSTEIGVPLFSTESIIPIDVVEISDDYPFPLAGQIIIESGDGFLFPGRLISPYSESLSSEEVSSEYVERSSQVVQFPFYDEDMVLKGYIELSNGPAYGQEIIKSIIWGWVIAGSLAVVISAIAGWLVSRKFSDPIISLTKASTEMADGSLTARAVVSSPDEFGLLANSFNRMAESLESKVNALRRFVADAAHELYTPITAIRANIELAANSKSDIEQEKHMAIALSQIDRMDDLTKGLLDLSNIEGIDVGAQFEDVDLGKMIRSLEEVFTSQAEQAGLIFKTEISSSPMVTKGNQSQLQAVIHNLFDNAIKFTPEGGEVKISLNHEGDKLILQVKDNGIGIPADDLPQLFNRFHRGQNTSNFKGSGLGLAIVRAIVESHDGEYFVESITKGSIFKIILNAKNSNK